MENYPSDEQREEDLQKLMDVLDECIEQVDRLYYAMRMKTLILTWFSKIAFLFGQFLLAILFY